MANGESNWLLIVVVVALGYFILVGNPFEKDSTEQETTDTNIGSAQGCSVEDISLAPRMTRMGKSGTSLTADNGYNYYIITDNLGSQAANTSTLVPTKYTMQILFAENVSSASDNRYYTVEQLIETDCQDPTYVSVKIPLADTILNSFYITNADGSVNSVRNNQSVGADDKVDLTVTMKVGSDTYFGNPTSDCENVAVVEYDKTHIKLVEGDTPEAVPGFFSYHNSTYDGSNGFIIPKIGDAEEAEFNIYIETTVSGLAASAPNTTYARLHIYDCDVDKDEDTLDLIEGVEDEDLNMISQANQTILVYLQTS